MLLFLEEGRRRPITTAHRHRHSLALGHAVQVTNLHKRNELDSACGSEAQQIYEVCA